MSVQYCNSGQRCIGLVWKSLSLAPGHSQIFTVYKHVASGLGTNSNQHPWQQCLRIVTNKTFKHSWSGVTLYYYDKLQRWYTILHKPKELKTVEWIHSFVSVFSTLNLFFVAIPLRPCTQPVGANFTQRGWRQRTQWLQQIMLSQMLITNNSMPP